MKTLKIFIFLVILSTSSVYAQGVMNITNNNPTAVDITCLVGGTPLASATFINVSGVSNGHIIGSAIDEIQITATGGSGGCTATLGPVTPPFNPGSSPYNVVACGFQVTLTVTGTAPNLVYTLTIN